MQLRHEEFGRRVKQARADMAWKQKQLAAAVSVEPVTVSRWERGEHMPDVATIQLIAEATGKTLSYFVADEQEGGWVAPADFNRLAASVEVLQARVDALLVDLAELRGGRSEPERGKR